MNITLTKGKLMLVATIILLLSMAFVQVYKTAHDLTWTVEEDFDRDQSFVQGTLDGNLGKDPSYKGEYVWYNPLLFLIETALVKITHLPINIILARGGIYLNFLAPLTFTFFCYFFFWRPCCFEFFNFPKINPFMCWIRHKICS